MKHSFLLIPAFFLLLASCNNGEEKKDTEAFVRNKNMSASNSDISKKRKTDSLVNVLRSTLDTMIIKGQVFYITEGDMVISPDELYEYCFYRLYSTLYDSSTYPKKKQIEEFTVSELGGVREIWPTGKKLTYAILRNSFPNEQLYDSTVRYMKEATAAWMNVCKIEFEHLQQFDSSAVITDPKDPVVFYVQYYYSSKNYLAKAFFPSDVDFLRKILIQPSFYDPGLSVSRTGILRHELGHVLGARHEHIWSKKEGCKGESVIEGFRGAKQLTPYDPYSVMHYLCGGAGTRTLELTTFDITGIQKLYGKK